MGNYQASFQRYELKFILNQKQYQKLLLKFRNLFISDKFGKTTVFSLYYDTDNKLLIRRSLEGPVYKEKLRLRSYGVVKPGGDAFVELKKKYKGVVYKRRTVMKYEDAIRFLAGDKKAAKESQISKEIEYFTTYYKNLEPSMLIFYDREAFTIKDEPDLRITFDRNIKFRDYDLTLQKPAYGECILMPDQILMEIKTAGALPLWLVHFMNENKIYKTSFSKYGNAYQIQNNRRSEDILV